MRDWLLVGALALCTCGLRAAGPLLLAGRDLPRRAQAAIALLAPALFAALVATQALTSGRAVTLDARVAGVGAAAVAIAARAPLPAVLLVATATTALLRAVG